MEHAISSPSKLQLDYRMELARNLNSIRPNQVAVAATFTRDDSMVSGRLQGISHELPQGSRCCCLGETGHAYWIWIILLCWICQIWIARPTYGWRCDASCGIAGFATRPCSYFCS